MSETHEPTEHAIGAHSVRFEEPDLYIIRQVGDISGAEMVAICDLVDEFVAGQKTVFAIIDQTDAGSTSSDARRTVVARLTKAHSGVVFLNPPLMERVGLSLGHKAYMMMNRGKEVAPHFFAATEAEARSWIEEQHAALASKTGK